MVRLVIKEHGLFLSIPKYGSFRTPVVINIHEDYIKYVESLLRKAGINNYSLEKIEKEKEKEKKIKKEGTNIVTIDLVSKVEDLGDVKDRLSNIEELLSMLLKKKDNIILSEEKPTKKKQNKKSEDLEEVFVPRLDNSGFVMKGDSSKSKKAEEIDTQIDALLQLKKM